MTTLNLQVSASTDDANSQSNISPTGGTGNIIAADLTNTLLSPGYHASNDIWYCGARFLNVTITQGATISSAIFTLRAQTTYNAGANTIKYTVSLQNSDTTNTFATTEANDLDATSRPRTTAQAVWTQTSVVADTDYTIDVTSAVQEVVNRASWASGNSMVVIIESHADTTNGEWQDYYSWDHASGPAPKLDITYGVAAASSTPTNGPRMPQAILAR